MTNKDNELTNLIDENSYAEEIKNIDNVLKENENYTLPSSLEDDNIKNLLSKQPKQKKRLKLSRVIPIAAIVAILLALGIGLTISALKVNKAINMTVDTEKISSYDDIENMFDLYSKNYKTVSKAQILDYGLKSDNYNGMVVEESAEDMAGGTADGSFSSYGETNVQVEGVNEADIIKNDGKYLYASSNSYYGIEGSKCYVTIVKPENDGTFTLCSEIEITYDDNTSYADISEFYLKDDKLIIIFNESCYSEEESYYNRSFTKVFIYDIEDRNNPKYCNCYIQDGYFSTSRLIDDRLILISTYTIDLSDRDDTIKKNCIPTCGTEYENMGRVAMEDICIMSPVVSTTYLVVSNINTNDTEDITQKAILGCSSDAYCTTETLYCMSGEYDRYNYDNAADIFGVEIWSSQITKLFKFDISDGKTEFIAQGQVDGHTLNQFSADEYNGYLRIATTSGYSTDTYTNQVYVLDENLNVTGSVIDIAKGEIIKSVRFMQDTGYVVTFEQTDPLFVLNFTNPYKPEIVGELKLPGYSQYLHPITDTLMLGLGVDGTEEGATDNLKLSLFDISDPNNPIETAKEVIIPEYTVPDGASYYYNYSYSPAQNDHKAFCYDKTNNRIFFPVSSEMYYEDAEGYSISKSERYVYSIEIDTDSKQFANPVKYEIEDFDPFNGYSVERATYINNLVYSLSYSGSNVEFRSFNYGNPDELSRFITEHDEYDYYYEDVEIPEEYSEGSDATLN